MTTDVDPEAEERYRLGARERRGLLAGWRSGQVASVAGGLVAGVIAMRVVPGDAGLGLALVLTLAGIAAACWPVRGRTLDEWAPAVARHAAQVVSGSDRHRSDDPGIGHLRLVDGSVKKRQRLRSGGRPNHFDGLSVVAAGGDGKAVGVVVDRAAGTCAAVVAVSGSGFALLGPSERRDRVGSWSRLLAATARDGTAVHRLQWVERCLPDVAAGARLHFERRGRDSKPEAWSSYDDVLELAGSGAVRHELYLVVTIRQLRAERRAGGSRPPGEATIERLVRETGAMERALRVAGAVVEGALTPQRLVSTLAVAFAPAERAGGEDLATAPAQPWPQAYEVEWDLLRTDATVHASYWVAEWPRTDVGNDFLVPLLTGGAGRRTVAVTLAPVAPLRASRDAEHARTSGVADAEVRRRHGFAVTARARRDHDAVLQREAELAAGHASYRFSGYVTVTGGDRAELERACETVERLAAGCQLELRRLYGAQADGFLASLPIGRGLS